MSQNEQHQGTDAPASPAIPPAPAEAIPLPPSPTTPALERMIALLESALERLVNRPAGTAAPFKLEGLPALLTAPRVVAISERAGVLHAVRDDGAVFAYDPTTNEWESCAPVPGTLAAGGDPLKESIDKAAEA